MARSIPPTSRRCSISPRKYRPTRTSSTLPPPKTRPCSPTYSRRIDPTALQTDEDTVSAAQDPNSAAFLQAINDSTVDAADGLKALAAEEASIPALLSDLDQANPADKTADDQITADTAKISQDAAAITAEQAKPAPDPTVIQNLKNDEAAMRKQIAADRGTAGYSDYKSAQEAIHAEAAALPAFGQVLTPDLKPQFDLWLKNSLRLYAITIEVSNYITQIIGGNTTELDGKTPVTYPGHVMPVIGSNPPELYIHFEPSGQIDMKIDNWFPPVGWEQPDGSDNTVNAPIFTTDDGSIRDVSYTPLGGEYQFTVVTRWASYVFKIARSRYDAADAAAGLQHYQGEINLYSDDASQLMRGSAVLDQNSDLE